MPQNIVSHKVADGLFLVSRTIPEGHVPAKPVEQAVNHILVVDCSGSMYGELDKVREHIKTKLPKAMKEADTLSLIAFSGRGQVWRILTAEPVATLSDLSEVNRAIDRWLRPVGLTGFKEPIEEVKKLVSDIGKKNKLPFSLFFMSDGCDNQSSKAEIIKAVEATAGDLAAATVVEYGFYADRPLLAKMAEGWGGALIFSDGFAKFSPILDASIQRKVVGGKKIEVEIKGDPVGGFVFALDDGEILTYGVEGCKVSFPESVSSFGYLSPTLIGKEGTLNVGEICGNLGGDYDGVLDAGGEQAASLAYAAISLFAVRMKPDVVFPLLKATGDVRLIEQFSSCFGKQRYSDFQELAQKATFDEKARWTKGFDPNKVPKDDAFTILDLLHLLQEDDDNRLLLGHEAFKYNRIGRSRVDSNTKLTASEQEELTKLTEELTKEKDLTKIKEVSSKIATLTNKPEPLKFVENASAKDEGYPISNLTFNEDRPNLSVLVRKEGTVDLSARLPEELKGKGLGKVPETFSTYTFRNFTIVKDGLVNVELLPVKVSRGTVKKLMKVADEERLSLEALGLRMNFTGNGPNAVIDLKALPVINRKMVKAVSARNLFEKEWELLKARASQKVYNSYLKEKFPGKKSEGFAALYGDGGAKWLADQGITDYSGFGPKMLQAEAQDVYMAKVLEVKLKGYSTIPSLNEYKKQALKGKFNGPGELMKPAVDETEAFLAGAKSDEEVETWLKGKAKETTKIIRGLLFEMAQEKMSVIVGQVWFSEFASLEEKSLDLTLDGKKLSFTAELREVEEKV